MTGEIGTHSANEAEMVGWLTPAISTGYCVQCCCSLYWVFGFCITCMFAGLHVCECQRSDKLLLYSDQSVCPWMSVLAMHLLIYEEISFRLHELWVIEVWQQYMHYSIFFFQWLLSWLLHKWKDYLLPNLGRKNNLPIFRLNASLVIRAKVKRCKQMLLFIAMHYQGYTSLKVKGRWGLLLPPCLLITVVQQPGTSSPPSRLKHSSEGVIWMYTTLNCLPRGNASLITFTLMMTGAFSWNVIFPS